MAGLRPSPAPGSLRPRGVRVQGAAALRRRSPTRPRGFSAPGGEASSGRRVEARSASLRSVNTPAPRASRRPEALTAARPEPAPPSPLPPRARPFVLERGPRMPLRGRESASDGLSSRLRTPEGSGPERRSERLRTALRNSGAGRAPSFWEGLGRPAEECDDTHQRNASLDLHRALGRCSIDPSPLRERNSPDRPPQPATEYRPDLRN